MKKFILFLFAFTILSIIFSCDADAQNRDRDLTFSTNQWIKDYTGKAGDTIGAGDSTWSYTILVNKPYKVLWDFYMDIDSVGGTAASCPIYIQYRTLDVDNFTDIDTIKWTGNVDTTFHKYQYTTPTEKREFRVLVKGSTSTFVAEIQRFIARFCRAQ